MQVAVELARVKPDKKLTRRDLLVKGGWLHPVWEWSRDVDMSLDDAILNTKKLGEEFKLVGKEKIKKRPKPKKGGSKEGKPATANAVKPIPPADTKVRRNNGGFFTKKSPKAPKQKEEQAHPAPPVPETNRAPLEALPMPPIAPKTTSRSSRQSAEIDGPVPRAAETPLGSTLEGPSAQKAPRRGIAGSLARLSGPLIRRLQLAWAVSFALVLPVFVLSRESLVSSLVLLADVAFGAVVLSIVLARMALKGAAATSGPVGQTPPDTP
jgi:hypothetical protein